MKNSRYALISADSIAARALAQIAVLFELRLNENWPGDITKPPVDTILIFHQLDVQADRAASICEVIYRSEAGLRYAARRECFDCSDGSRLHWLVRLNLYHLLCSVTGKTPSPWGTLSGVRPAKLVHRLLDDGCPPAVVAQKLTQEYALRPEKAQLVTGVALRQRPFLLPLSERKRKVSIYIGIPFGPTRCLYCSFPAYVLPDQNRTQAFLAALFADMDAARRCLKRLNLSVQTVYIGGGTPTSLKYSELKALLARTVELFAHEASEFTVEAGRPDSLDDDKIGLLAEYGVSRVSVNPQTMQEKTLKLIGRMHSVQDIITIFGKIRMCNIPVVNMDLIAGLPGETTEDMADTLRQVAALGPDNLTVHTLALKRGSRLSDNLDMYARPGAEITGQMLALAGQTAASLGMSAYYLYRQKKMAGNLENIGFALPGKECIYNIQVIEERQTIIGIGPASTTKAIGAGGLANFFQPKDISTYINTLHERLARRDALLNLAAAE